ncbi:MAG: hypothetical protein ACYDBW_08800 [Sulfuricaulis sp.]
MVSRKAAAVLGTPDASPCAGFGEIRDLYEFAIVASQDKLDALLYGECLKIKGYLRIAIDENMAHCNWFFEYTLLAQHVMNLHHLYRLTSLPCGEDYVHGLLRYEKLMGENMQGQYNKIDVAKALKLRALGLSNTIIAKRLNVTTGAIYLAFRKYDAEHNTPVDARPRRRTQCESDAPLRLIGTRFGVYAE